MVLPRRPGWEVLLLFWGSWGCWASPVPLIPCPEPCVCLDHTLINCSSSGLPHAPQHPSMDRTADLDLSHNLLSSVALRRPNPELLALRLGNNQISYLSLCLNEWSSDRVGRRMPSPGAWRSQRSQRCVSWAPGLLLLSMERNRLAESPRGLGGSRALQVLQLSYNQISTLEAGDLEGLHQLKELHLQHNLISSLHPRAFVGLTNLTVVDLSFNLLTSLSPATFWSLRLGLVVRGGGNPWRCDCEMANLKRRMALDEDEDQRLWLDMVCHSPSSLAGRDLLQLHEEDFGCGGAKNKPGLHQDLTVDHGSTVLLPCSMQKGSTWWTPKGQVSANESQAGLLMSDITERDAGLYICLSQSHKDIVSVYNLKIRKQARANSRLPRSLPVDTQGIGRAGQVRAMTEKQRLGLAVGLSIFFTFLVAFILGVFARPCIDVLCQKVCVKKNAPAQPGSVSSAGQSPYDNQAYSDEEDDPEIVSVRERRVTFSTQENQEESMNYKVTWANGQPKNQSSSSDEEQGNSTRTKMKSLKASSSQPVDSELGERGRLSSSSDEEQGNSTRTRKKSLKASSSQPVDSELGERGSLSSSSDEEEGNSTRTKKKSSIASPSQPVDNCINQKETDLEFTSEPFADWSPHLNDAKLRDQDQPNDSGDAFDFPESIQSGSARSSSLSGSLNHSKKFVFPTSNDLRQANRSRSSSSSSSASHLSEDESTQYTVNQETEEWAGMGMDQDVQNIDQTKIIKGVVSFDKQTHSKQPISITSQEVLEGELQNTQMAPDHFESSLSSSCESDDEVTEYTFNQGAADEDEGTGRNSKNIDAQNNVWPKLDFSHVTRIKQRLDITVETINTGPAVTSKDTGSVYRTQVKPRLDIKASTDFTSSSSESEEENTKIENAYQPHLCLGTVNPSKDFEIYAQENTWPELDLNNITGVKRHLDIKVVTETTGPAVPLNDTDQDYRYHANPLPVIKESTDFTSSSSESEDEPNMHLDTVSQIKDFEINAQEDRWPELKLGNVNRVKRRLDIKATTETTDPAVLLKDTDQDYRWSQLDLSNIHQVKQPVHIKASTDSTSSSDSDEEPTGVRTKIENTSPLIAHLGTVSQKKGSEMNVQNENWPVLDLSHVSRVKRRLDIKVATENTGPAVTLRDTDQDYRYNVKPHPDYTASTASTSSSSESEEEPNMHLDTVSQIKDFEINAQEDRWPELKLGNVNRVKRRLDIKATTETIDPAVLLKDTDQNYRWSQLDLGNINQVKQPVHIKASTDSTSSSDSDEEPTDVRTRIENTSPLIAHLGTVSQKQESEMNVQNENWPVLDLIHVTRVKRHLDIKVATENTGPAVTLRDTDQDYRYNVKPHPDYAASTASTSSSSDSEEEIMGPVVNLEDTYVKTKVENAYQPHLHVGTAGSIKDLEIGARDDGWPELDLGNINRVKRRLDIKATTETGNPAVTLRDTDQDYRFHVKPRPESTASIDSTSSSSESEEATPGLLVNLDDSYVKTKVETAYQPHLQLGTIQDSEINAREERWPKLNLSNISGIKQHLDIKVKPHPEIKESTDFTSSSSESEEDFTVVNLDNAYVKTKVENAYQPKLHLDKVSPIKDIEINAQEDRWPELDLGNVNRVKRRLDIKATTENTDPAVLLKDTDQDYRWSQLDLGNINQVKHPVHIKASTDSTSRSDSDVEPTDVRMKIAKFSTPIVHLGTVEPNKESEMNVQKGNWPLVDLNRVKRRLDIRVGTETTGPTLILEDTDQDYRYHVKTRRETSTDYTSSSSSSDSEEESRGPAMNVDDKTKEENTHKPSLHLGTVKPIKDTEVDAKNDRWPELDLSQLPHIKRRLDFKASIKTPSSAVDDTDDDWWSHTDLDNITRSKRRLDVKVPTPLPERTSISSGLPLQSRSSSSSNDSDGEMKVQMVKEEREDPVVGTMSEIRWPDLNPRVPRIKRRIDVKTPLPIPHPGKVDPVQNDIGSSTSESEDEKQVQTRQHESEVHVLSPTTKNESIVHFKGPLYDDSLTSKRDPIIKLEKYAVITDGLDDNNKGLKSIPGPEYTPDLESRWAGLNLGKSRLRQRLDISANKAAPLKVSSETEIRSSSGERVDKIKEWAEKSSSVKDSDIDAQKETWPLVDLGNVTGVKRRLDIKVATPSPTSSSGDSGEANSWPVLDLDNISGIKRRLDIKTTPSSNISIEDWNTRLESPPPVPDSSTSSESENASMRHRRVDFPEYHTHGPARSFAQSVRGTSDTEVDSSFTTVDIKGWRSVKMGTQERRGLGALRAMSSERKRWDTDDKELGAEGSSQQNSHQGLPLREAPSLNYSFSGEDLEPHSSIISVQEASAPERLSRSRQRTEYQNRLMGRDRQGGDTKVDLRHPPEYLEIQNSTLFDSSNPMSEV